VHAVGEVPAAAGHAVACVHAPVKLHCGSPPPAVVLHAAALTGLTGHAVV
jgi:hypothetical protein